MTKEIHCSSRKRRAFIWLLVSALLCSIMFRAPIHDFFRGYADGSSDSLELALKKANTVDQLGMTRFVFDDFNGLSTDTMKTNALPWKLVTAAIVLERNREGAPVNHTTLRTALAEFGFLWPTSIANWSLASDPPTLERPIGIIAGMVSRNVPKIRVEVANIGCAACHSGPTYGEDGVATQDVWLGLPNTSLDLEAYVQKVYHSLKETAKDPEKTLAAVKILYPDIDPVELHTLRKYVIPLLQKRLPEIEESYDAPTPFSNGSPGVTNGVASLKLQLGLVGDHAEPGETGFTSIPDLGGTALRSSLLYDGLYATPGKERFRPLIRTDVSPDHLRELAHIANFFIAPTMGVSPRRALDSTNQMEEVMQFIDTYTPPPFPGKIDSQKAIRGAEVFAKSCSDCHGTYSEGADDPRLESLNNRLVPGEEIGTDPQRYEVVDKSLEEAVRRSPYRKHVDVGRTRGYVGKPLSGLWATAPYLHNGSVPTLWHLMHPDIRPERFYVGGHRLDFQKVGIAGEISEDGIYQDDDKHQAWKAPRLYDTSQPGCSNRGHALVFTELSEDQKSDLLEYLKQL